jgi:hypothetical protein
MENFRQRRHRPQDAREFAAPGIIATTRAHPLPITTDN